MRIKFFHNNEIRISEINPSDWMLFSEGIEICQKFDDSWIKVVEEFKCRKMVIKNKPLEASGYDYAEDPSFNANEFLRDAMQCCVPIILVLADQDLSQIEEDGFFPSQNKINLSSDSIGIGGGGSHWTR